VSGIGYLLAPKPGRLDPVVPRRLLVDGATFWRTPDLPRQFDFAASGDWIQIVFAGGNGLSVWNEELALNRDLELRGAEGWQAGGTDGSGVVPRWSPDGRQVLFQAYKRIAGLEVQPMNEWSLFLARADTDHARRLGPEFPAAERVLDLAWHPDGEHVTLVTVRRRFSTLSIASGAITPCKDLALPAHQHPLLGDYSPDGRWLAMSIESRSGGAKLERAIWLAPHGGGKALRLTESPGFHSFPTWAPGGGSVYFASSGEQRRGDAWGLWKLDVDPATGSPLGPAVEFVSKQGQQMSHPRFVGRGGKLAYAGNDSNTRICTAAVDRLEHAVAVARGRAPILSADGSTVYFAGETAEQKGMHAISRTGGLPRKLSDLEPVYHPIMRSGLALSRDGQSIALTASDGKRLGVFLLATTGGAPRLIEELAAAEPTVPAWSPDGQWLGVVNRGTLYRVSRDGHSREALATAHRWDGTSVRWSPDGGWIAALAHETPAHAQRGNPSVLAISVADKRSRRRSPEDTKQHKEGLEWHPDSAD
jgi:Tol biopolymer transport system component